jgi:Activator of Hsp90 ATPase homolog 1-like protein
MKKTLEFVVQIESPRNVVWDAMLGPESYKDWTSGFCEGSYYKGSWAQGEKMQFLSPGGDGMSSEIAENRLHEFVSIRHVGEILQGVEDVTSDKVRAWAPAYENYTFTDVPGGTQVRVTVDTLPEYVEFMTEAYPRSLERLKAICEAAVRTKSEA